MQVQAGDESPLGTVTASCGPNSVRRRIGFSDQPAVPLLGRLLKDHRNRVSARELRHHPGRLPTARFWAMSRGGALRRFGMVEDDQSRSAQAPDRAYARQLDGERSAAALEPAPGRGRGTQQGTANEQNDVN